MNMIINFWVDIRRGGNFLTRWAKCPVLKRDSSTWSWYGEDSRCKHDSNSVFNCDNSSRKTCHALLRSVTFWQELSGTKSRFGFVMARSFIPRWRRVSHLSPWLQVVLKSQLLLIPQNQYNLLQHSLHSQQHSSITTSPPTLMAE